MADVLEIDLADAITAKVESNELKYPVDRSKGSAAKYTTFGDAGGEK